MTILCIFRKIFFSYPKNIFSIEKKVGKIIETYIDVKFSEESIFGIFRAVWAVCGLQIRLWTQKSWFASWTPWFDLPDPQNSDLHFELELQNTKTYNFFQKQFFDV